eukprot:TRINITY_DN8555_c0_g1_i1.p3 TRINITY_DN8555_c0_g1~~TRINITY_DN8555_c0_g1_i1.p3  ORF type:complete len:302 (-),score=69.74 TRINITY_DN8555_c0_g1_i1:3455-4360(-)
MAWHSWCLLTSLLLITAMPAAETSSGKKRAVEPGSDDKPSWLDAFQKSLENTLDAKFDSFAGTIVKRVDTIADAQQQMQISMQTMDDRIKKLETTGPGGTQPAGSTVASIDDQQDNAKCNIELKGWAAFNERQTRGLTRSQCVTLSNTLKETLPAELHQHVFEPILFGAKNNSILIPTTKHASREILGCWKEEVQKLQDNELYRGIFVRMEPTPARKMITSTTARALRFAETSIKKQGVKIETFFYPDYKIFIIDNDAKPVLAASVSEVTPKQVHWTAEAKQYLGLASDADVEFAFRKFRG